jgi:hypothetical protein
MENSSRAGGRGWVGGLLLHRTPSPKAPADACFPGKANSPFESLPFRGRDATVNQHIEEYLAKRVRQS